MPNQYTSPYVTTNLNTVQPKQSTYTININDIDWGFSSTTKVDNKSDKVEALLERIKSLVDCIDSIDETDVKDINIALNDSLSLLKEIRDIYVN